MGSVHPYQPVSCDLHSRLELAILRRQTLTLRWQESEAGTADPPTDGIHSATLRLLDIYTRDGAEWLEVEPLDGGTVFRLRLDQLLD